jgi:tetratricopeptide (TPR) repeat protein
MGFFDSLKKSMELKQPQKNSKNNQKDLGEIKKLENELEKNPNSFDLLYELYGCYIDLSDTHKKIECLEKMMQIKPNDSFPLGQLAQIYYSELQNPQKGKYYQDKANRINSNKFL